MACGGKGHRKDACTNSPASAKRDDGASSAKAAKAEAPPRAKGQDPGLKRVLSEAAGVLKRCYRVKQRLGTARARATQISTRGQPPPPLATQVEVAALSRR